MFDIQRGYCDKVAKMTSFIGQFVITVGEWSDGGIVIYASYMFHFIRVNDNLVQDLNE